MAFYRWESRQEASTVSRYRSRYMSSLLLTLALILGLGSMLTQYLGELALERIKTDADEYSSIVVSRLNTEFKRMEDAVRAMAESPWIIAGPDPAHDRKTWKTPIPHWTAIKKRWTLRSVI